jgi:hypothetical protein
MGTTGWGGSVTLYVEADFSQTISETSGAPVTGTSTQWGSATWGTSSWQPPITTEWTDITSDVRSVSCGAAFSRQTNRYNTATASVVLDNRSGIYSPTNTGGADPASAPYYQKIGILRPMRIRATYTNDAGVATSWALFTGLIQSWAEDFPSFGKDATVTVGLVGNDSQLANITNVAGSPVGAGENAGARVRRILADADWRWPSFIDDGETTMQATTLEGTPQSLLTLTADSEGGAFYCAPDGSLRFDGFQAQIEKSGRTIPALHFSDAPADSSTLTYADIALSYDGDLVRNSITYQRVGGTAQTVTAAASQQLYGTRSESRSDLICQSDTDVAAIARRDLSVLQDPEHRIESVKLNPLDPNNADGRLWVALATQAIALRLGALVEYTPQNQTTLSRYVFIEGISHTISADRWQISLTFSSATAYRPRALSRWGAGTWGDVSWTW